MGPEDPLEKEMATHSSILAWRIPWTEEPGGLQSLGLQRVGLTLSFSLFLDGAGWLEGSGLGYFLFLRWGRSAGL